MKLETIGYPERDTFVPQLKTDGFDEHPVPTGGEIKLTFKDGTIIIFTTSEWGNCYVKESV